MILKIASWRHGNKRILELALLLLVTGFLILNQWHMIAVHDLLPAPVAAANNTIVPQPMASMGGTASDTLPHGIPERYGAKLGVSFDSAAAAIPILENFDRGPGTITLTGELLKRYINIGSQTSCEFCCGATTLVFPDGKPACGCAHSAAMRGLALYLLQQYPEMPDGEILAEVNRWKAVFFPGPTAQKLNSGSVQPGNQSGALPTQVGGC